MFGIFRLLLAIMVVLAHMDYRWNGFHPGVTAVVGFYMLSGYFVASLYERENLPLVASFWPFYRDRVMRIFPFYFFIGILTVIFILTTGYSTMKWTWSAFIGNILIIPLNYYMYFDNVVFPELRFWLVPTAWSLGLELQFYLLFPFLARLPALRRMLTLTSLIIFWLGAYGVITTDLFTYRLVPGTVFMFITGALLYYEKTMPLRLGREYLVGWAIWGSTILGWVGLYLSDRQRIPYVTEVCWGVILSYPILRWLAWHASYKRTDDLFGSLAYGMFLGHFLVIWSYSYSQGRVTESYVDDLSATVIILTATIALSLIGYFAIDRPLRRYRRYLRSVGQAD